MDSNPRSPVRRTTLFETPLPNMRRATAAFENARRPVQQLLLPVVDPVRMNAELTRQLSDRLEQGDEADTEEAQRGD